MPLSDKKLDLTSLIEELAKRTVVYQVSKISRAFLSDSTKPGEEGTHLKTEGVNIQVHKSLCYFCCYKQDNYVHEFNIRKKVLRKLWHKKKHDIVYDAYYEI